MSLVGKLRAWSYCVRPGRYFLNRIYSCFKGRRKLDHSFPLAGTRLQEDLSFWRLLLTHTLSQSTSFTSPLWGHVARPAEFLCISDACEEGGGGYIAPIHIWWQWRWPSFIVDQVRRTKRGGSPAHARVTIAHLEMAAIYITVALLVDQAVTHGISLYGRTILALADNTNAVIWTNRKGARDTVLLGLLEVQFGYSSFSRHLPGPQNGVADAASRLSAHDVRTLLLTTPCPLSLLPTNWTQVQPPAKSLQLIAGVLGDFTPAKL